MNYKKILISFVIIIVFNSCSSAQNSLIDTIGLIPDDNSSTSALYFYNIEGIAKAYPGAKGSSDRLWYHDSEDIGQMLWYQIFYSWNFNSTIGWDGINDANLINLIGFDFFDIKQAIAFGKFPISSFIFKGDFDNHKIKSAYYDMGYSPYTDSSADIICGKDGITSGNKMNLVPRDSSNPFVGMYGNQQTILFTKIS